MQRTSQQVHASLLQHYSTMAGQIKQALEPDKLMCFKN
jgi:hypothetical protein